jgi:hypothetical protein
MYVHVDDLGAEGGHRGVHQGSGVLFREGHCEQSGCGGKAHIDVLVSMITIKTLYV